MHDEGKDNPLDWQEITPKELHPAVKAIHKAFDDASWNCSESARRLCFAGLHPTPGNPPPTNLTSDLDPYKKYLAAAIGDRAHEVIAKSNQTPPAIFKAYLDLYRIGLIAAIRNLFEEALQIGIAQKSIMKLPPVEWATSLLRIFIDGEKPSVQLWIKRVCDVQDNSGVPQNEEDFDEAFYWRTWRAPQLIRMVPAGNLPYYDGTAWEREDENASRRLLESHCKRFIFCCYSDLDKVAGNAQVQLAKRPMGQVAPSREKSPEANSGQGTSANRKPAANLDYRSELKRAVSLVLVINPLATDLDICRRLDADGNVELPPRLANAGRGRLFVDAYRDPRRRHRLEVTFSRVRKDMRDRGLLGSSSRG